MKKEGRSPTVRVYAVLTLIALIFAGGGISPVLGDPPRPEMPGGPDPVPVTPYPILFVTQVPIPADFTTIGSVFGNHRAAVDSCGRGGDLWIRYPNGNLKNLTALAGYGNSGFQGAGSIAVRDPSVHWSGTKALFSMVVGATTQQYVWQQNWWQIYEVTGLGENDTPVITLVPNQPQGYNNVSPIYGTDDRIIFTSDRPRNGAAWLHPQRDEYEEAPTVTGLWSLNPSVGDLFLLNHAPSGDFTPVIDSFGRVIFTQWDHLQRDQQADADALGTANYGTFNYSNESTGGVPLNDRTEVFPEPRPIRVDLLAGTNLTGHTFNHFFPWQANEDGTEIETILHIGRHELHSYFNKSMNGDPNLVEFTASTSGRTNPNSVNNLLQVKESPFTSGTYYAVDAPEFYTHASGQIVRFTASPATNPDLVTITYVTHRDTASFTANPSLNHSGHYREPLPLSDGTLIAVHTPETDLDTNIGTSANPQSRYDFRLKTVVQSGAYWTAGLPLTSGISKTVSYWSPDILVNYSGPLWELSPVEVRSRTRPARLVPSLAQPEAAAFGIAGVDPNAFRAYLFENNLALIVSRNVTTRDDADKQQPFNLRVAGTTTQTVGASGTLYDVKHLQIFQADLLRGIGGYQSPSPGRRVLAQALHDPAVVNPPNPSGPLGSVAVAADGSLAALVPARRAVTWQLTDPAGLGVIRERYWLSFQPGEIRVCASCHGINQSSQAGLAPPTNPPAALTSLLQFWQASTPAAPSLGSAGTGSVGLGAGGPYDVLSINGSFGGSSRRVDVPIGQPITIGLSQPPSNPVPAHFAIWGISGAPSPEAAVSTVFGTISFAPTPLFPTAPFLFTLTNNLWSDPTSLLTSSTAPFALSTPGLPIPATLTFQGMVVDSASLGNLPGITNGVILRVQ